MVDRKTIADTYIRHSHHFIGNEISLSVFKVASLYYTKFMYDPWYWKPGKWGTCCTIIPTYIFFENHFCLKYFMVNFFFWLWLSIASGSVANIITLFKIEFSNFLHLFCDHYLPLAPTKKIVHFYSKPTKDAKLWKCPEMVLPLKSYMISWEN